MKTIEIISDGRKVQLTTKSLTMDGKEYFYARMSGITKNTAESSYTFQYGDESKTIHYDDKTEKGLDTIFTQVQNLQAKRANAAGASVQQDKVPEQTPVPEQISDEGQTAQPSSEGKNTLPETQEQEQEPESVQESAQEQAQEQAQTQAQAQAEAQAVPEQTAEPEKKMTRKGKPKGFWSLGRLIIGIVSIVLALYVLFQSFFAGLYNALADTGDLGGSAGAITAILMIVAGIIAICTRNSQKGGGCIVIFIMYFLGALLSLANCGVFSDLIAWGVICAGFGIVFVICMFKARPSEQGNTGFLTKGHKIWLIIIIVVVAAACAGIAIAVSDGSSSSSSGSSASSAQSENSDSGTFNDCDVTIKDYEVTKDYDGKNAIVISYDFTNNSDDSMSFYAACSYTVFQNGEELDYTIVENDEDEDLDDSTGKEIQPGKTIEVCTTSRLKNTTDDVTVEVDDILGLEDKISKTFKIEE